MPLSSSLKGLANVLRVVHNARGEARNTVIIPREAAGNILFWFHPRTPTDVVNEVVVST